MRCNNCGELLNKIQDHSKTGNEADDWETKNWTCGNCGQIYSESTTA